MWPRRRKPRWSDRGLDAIADRGYFNGEVILACEKAGITVTLPKPMTSNAKAEGHFGKQDFRYRYTNEENGLMLRRYWTHGGPTCLPVVLTKRMITRSPPQPNVGRLRGRAGGAARPYASDFGPGRRGGDHRGFASAPDSIALKVISMSCAGKASLVTPIRLLAH